MSQKSDRYQNQPWYVRLWRRRHYVPIPYRAVRIWVSDRKSDDPIGFRNCWGLAIGLAQCSMKWYYDWDEVKARLDRKLK